MRSSESACRDDRGSLPVEIPSVRRDHDTGLGYRLVKRTLDVAVAATALVVFAPLLLVLATLVRVKLGRPILFAQTRPGHRARLFRLYKFRTMRELFDARGRPRDDDDRLTPFGSWLRSTSLDELPSLWNVLRGDLSLVGPRPLLPEYLPLYDAEQARRHEVPPGLTGLAQTNGRNALSWPEKFALDIAYVETRSLALDLRILAATIGQVWRRDGIAAEGSTTMPRFTGNEPVEPTGASAERSDRVA